MLFFKLLEPVFSSFTLAFFVGLAAFSLCFLGFVSSRQLDVQPGFLSGFILRRLSRRCLIRRCLIRRRLIRRRLIRRRLGPFDLVGGRGNLCGGFLIGA